MDEVPIGIAGTADLLIGSSFEANREIGVPRVQFEPLDRICYRNIQCHAGRSDEQLQTLDKASKIGLPSVFLSREPDNQQGMPSSDLEESTGHDGRRHGVHAGADGADA